MSRRQITIMPASLLEHGTWAKLSGSAAKLLAAFYHHANRAGRCWPSKQTLCNLSGLKSSAMYEAMKELRSAGLVVPIENAKGGKGKWATYQLTVRNRGEFEYNKVSGMADDTLRNRGINSPESRNKLSAKPETEQPIEQVRNKTHKQGAAVAAMDGGLRSKGGKTANRFPALTIAPQDLRDNRRLANIYERLQQAGVVNGCERDRLYVWGMAEHALAVGKNPGAMFRAMIERGERTTITEEAEQKAHARIKAHYEGIQRREPEYDPTA